MSDQRPRSHKETLSLRIFVDVPRGRGIMQFNRPNEDSFWPILSPSGPSHRSFIMAPYEIEEPVRHLELDIDLETGRTPVTTSGTTTADVPSADDLKPAVHKRCGSTERELLDQPFCDAPLHRRAR